jgi:TetR/AcrR family transcriptional regulator, transcriptional repressor for nem operon
LTRATECAILRPISLLFGEETMRKGQETHNRIAAQAAALFNVTGYSGTAMSDIMRATRLEKGGIYRHFASKEQLSLAAFDYAAEQVRQRFAASLAESESAIDTLVAFLAVFRSYAERPPLPGGCPVLNTAIECDDTNPALRERTAAIIAEWCALFHAIVSAGIACSEIDPEVDAQQLALLCIATMEGGVMLARLLGDSTPLEVAYQHLCRYLEHSVRLH